MKKMFILLAMFGGFCVLGAAGMADTFIGEQMFALLFVGILCCVIGGLGAHICTLRRTEREIARRVALLRG